MQCEEAVSARYEMLDEYSKIKSEVGALRTQVAKDRENNKMLQEVIRTDHFT